MRRINSGVVGKIRLSRYIFSPLSHIGAKESLGVDKLMMWFTYVLYGEYVVEEENYRIMDEPSRKLIYDCLAKKFYTDYAPERYVSSVKQAYPFHKLVKLISDDYYRLRFWRIDVEDISKLKKAGHKIEYHSVLHDILSQLSKEELERDFKECVGSSVYNTDIYAYPFGHWRDVSSDVVKACEDAGIEYAVMNEVASKETKHTISRISFGWYTNRYELEAHLSGIADSIKRMFK